MFRALGHTLQACEAIRSRFWLPCDCACVVDFELETLCQALAAHHPHASPHIPAQRACEGFLPAAPEPQTPRDRSCCPDSCRTSYIATPSHPLRPCCLPNCTLASELLGFYRFLGHLDLDSWRKGPWQKTFTVSEGELSYVQQPGRLQVYLYSCPHGL